MIQHIEITDLSCTSSSSVVAFVGSPSRFSDRMLLILGDEFPDYRFLRYQTLLDLDARLDPTDVIDVVVLEDSHITALLADPAPYMNVVREAQLAIAFPHAGVAIQFQELRKTHAALESVGLLPLNAQIDVWIAVMRLLMCGQIYVQQTLVDDILRQTQARAPCASDMPTDVAEKFKDLTSREREILELVATGRQNKVIANELAVSEHTVKLHIHNLLKKLGVSNRTIATTWYHQVAGSRSVSHASRR
jgi:DNA-binding NarL/FixJ family response regulator